MFAKKIPTALSFLTAAFMLSTGINLGSSFINGAEAKDTGLPGRFTTRCPKPAKSPLPKGGCVPKKMNKALGIAHYEYCMAYIECRKYPRDLAVFIWSKSRKAKSSTYLSSHPASGKSKTKIGCENFAMDCPGRARRPKI